jgi:hypothetical protein
MQGEPTLAGGTREATPPLPGVTPVRPTPEAPELTPAPTGLHRVLRLTNSMLVPVALLAVVLATTMVIVLHLLPGWGGVNPITGMLSDYGVRPDGWVFDTALDILSVGSVAVLIKMALHGVLRGRATIALMISWCVCLVGIATFTKDPNDAETLRGSVHLAVTTAACVSLPVAGMVIGWQHRRDPAWRRWAWTVQSLSLFSVPCFLPFLISFFVIRMTHGNGPSSVPTGLVERLMGSLDVLILVVLTLWSHRAAVRARSALEPA